MNRLRYWCLVSLPDFWHKCLLNLHGDNAELLLNRVELLGAAQATAEREDTFFCLLASGRVAHVQRAVLAFAIFQFYFTTATDILSMASIAAIHGTTAVEKCHGAAVTTFPVDIAISMLFALFRSSAQILQKADLAAEFFFLDLFAFLLSHLLLTVDQPAEEWLDALATLVERAFVEGKFKWLLKKVITWG